MIEPASVDKKRSLADCRKIVCDFKAYDSRGLGDDGSDQLTKVGYIPLTVSQPEEVLLKNIVPLHRERLDKSVVRGGHAQVLVDNHNRLGHGIHPRLAPARVRSAANDIGLPASLRHLFRSRPGDRSGLTTELEQH